jgi:hypothetical protein
MPCGGGDVGLNVWVENGDVLCYLSRSGTFDENNAMLKLGRLRLKLSSETPQLYPVFPWGIYGVGKPDLDIVRNTWEYDPHAVKFRSHVGWRQYNILPPAWG